jgi:uncharacterized membrane protein
MSLAEAPVFEALIVPHRSLTPKGILAVAGAFLVLTVVVAVRFWIWGAWPVAVFSFVELPVLAILLTINQRRARASELIMLDATHLKVVRTDASGRCQQEALPAAWLRIDLDSTKGRSRILASSHGRGCEVGAFLHEPDRVSLFDALKSALHHVRNPRFDNPQLREQ